MSTQPSKDETPLLSRNSAWIPKPKQLLPRNRPTLVIVSLGGPYGPKNVMRLLAE